MKVLVLGASGLLGNSICKQLEKKDIQIISHGFKSHKVNLNYNLLDKKQLEKLLTENNPDVVINLIALSDVDLCQNNPRLALDLNANLVKNIEAILKKTKTRFLHISTDHVYHKEGQSKENEVFINNVYASTKLLGDKYTELSKSIVLRTNFFGKSLHPTRESFSDWIVKCLKKKKDIYLYKDVFFNPISMKTLSEGIFFLISKNNWKPDIYNFGSQERISKYDFGIKLADNFGLKKEFILPGKISDSILRASRPRDMSMDISKFEKIFKFKLPSIEEEISLLRKDYQ